jgi:putative sigma-54 modulation protein
MQIVVTGRHGHLTPEQHTEIESKVSKLLHYFNRVEAINVTVDLHNGSSPFLVEVQLNAEHKHDFVAKESNHDLHVAVDAAVAKMEQQIRKYKERIQNHHRTPARGDQAGL